MNWNDLKLFKAVAVGGTLSDAAKLLEMSHTTVFRRLKSLEDTIGARLFDRINGRYALTDAGQRLLPKVHAMSSIAEDAMRDLSGENQAVRGTVVVTAPSSFATHFIPDYLHELSALYPEINVTLLVTSEELDMNARQADIALRVASAPPDHLVGRKVLSVRWGVYGGVRYLQESGRPQHINDMKGHKFIGAIGALAAKDAFKWLEQHDWMVIQNRTDNLSAMASLAVADHGLVVLPDDLWQDGLERCLTLDQAGENSLWILTHPDLRRVERIKVVMSFLGEKLRREERLRPMAQD